MKRQIEEKIITLHPLGKKGANISLVKYQQIKDFIVETIAKHGEITFTKLSEIALKELTGKFDGKIKWYVVTVKLDLEARQIIERIQKTTPQKLGLK
ncbi:MAG: hypothetical protein CO098_11405 [Bacteroidetes bacterium CG_4_9_14_3_um_filter_41_19]|nr:MAG: hypothetical protein CO098_11405 [Bacteroidetes bacterium CG_4_9_14_3_um_filter_41_19]